MKFYICKSYELETKKAEYCDTCIKRYGLKHSVGETKATAVEVSKLSSDDVLIGISKNVRVMTSISLFQHILFILSIAFTVYVWLG